MATQLEIPAAHRPALAKLAGLSAEQRRSFLQGLREAPPALLLADLAGRLEPAVGLEKTELLPIMTMLASMYESRRHGKEDVSEFAQLVVEAAQRTKEVNPDDWDEFRKIIEQLLSCDNSLGVTAKAVGVMSDHERVYCRSRVLTDIRPVFTNEAARGPAAITIIHTLRISFHAATGDTDTEAFYVALDTVDLGDLKKQIDRALEKERSIRQLLRATNLPILATENT